MFWLRFRPVAALCALLLSLGAVSCRTVPHRSAAANRLAIQARTTNHFSDVVLLKPAASADETSLTTRLAPLLIQTATPTNTSTLSADHPAPQLQAHKGIVLINNRWHWQYTYTWQPPTGQQRNQGVRLTLDSRDTPGLWEILSDSSGQQILYVSQTLEHAARAESGPPLPGRKFSIERSLDESPDVVVANVIEDGPMAMGPILYLDDNHDVLALICRCMPAQFQNLRAQTDYELFPPATKQQAESPFPSARLEQHLRLPSRF
jgi:hypothetical protein